MNTSIISDLSTALKAWYYNSNNNFGNFLKYMQVGDQKLIILLEWPRRNRNSGPDFTVKRNRNSVDYNNILVSQ